MARRGLNEEEAKLWQAVVRDIKPLRPQGAPPKPPASKPEPAPRPSARQSPSAGPVSTPTVTESFAAVMAAARPRLSKHHSERPADLNIGIRAPGLDDTTWKRLSRGRMRMDARLDLHGYVVHEAFEQLHAFLGRAVSRNMRCVEVVTGLGSGETSGMIRRELPLWLQREDLRPYVLAVVHPHAANHGSVRILLRSRRRF